jgi:hypothetical protein
LHSFHVEDNFTTNTLDTANYKLNINKDQLTNMEFGVNGKSLIIFSEGKLTLMDYDGLNTNTILNDFNFIENRILFTNNSTELYALVKEKNELGEDINNLYKFDLEQN